MFFAFDATSREIIICLWRALALHARVWEIAAVLYNVAGLLKSPTGETREVELDAPVNLAEPELQLVAPVRGKLRFIRDYAGVLVVGRLTTRVLTECSRCLEPVEVGLTIDLGEQFRPTVFIPGGPPIQPGTDPAEGEWATQIDAHHQLDLAEVLRQAVLLEAPLHPLCRADCAGLCPHCGANLNDAPCGCAPEPDARWAALQVLLTPADAGRARRVSLESDESEEKEG